jgi:hypothetical protein
MAVRGDETCVARSNGSMLSLHDYRPSSYQAPGSAERRLPWRRPVIELVEDLALERLPEHLTQTIREQRERDRSAANGPPDRTGPASRTRHRVGNRRRHNGAASLEHPYL